MPTCLHALIYFRHKYVFADPTSGAITHIAKEPYK